MRWEFERFHKMRLMRCGKLGADILEKWKNSKGKYVDIGDVQKVHDWYGMRYQDIIFLLDILECNIDYEKLEELAAEEYKNRPRMIQCSKNT